MNYIARLVARATNGQSVVSRMAGSSQVAPFHTKQGHLQRMEDGDEGNLQKKDAETDDNEVQRMVTDAGNDWVSQSSQSSVLQREEEDETAQTLRRSNVLRRTNNGEDEEDSVQPSRIDGSNGQGGVLQTMKTDGKQADKDELQPSRVALNQANSTLQRSNDKEEEAQTLRRSHVLSNNLQRVDKDGEAEEQVQPSRLESSGTSSKIGGGMLSRSVAETNTDEESVQPLRVSAGQPTVGTGSAAAPAPILGLFGGNDGTHTSLSHSPAAPLMAEISLTVPSGPATSENTTASEALQTSDKLLDIEDPIALEKAAAFALSLKADLNELGAFSEHPSLFNTESSLDGPQDNAINASLEREQSAQTRPTSQVVIEHIDVILEAPANPSLAQRQEQSTTAFAEGGVNQMSRAQHLSARYLRRL